MRVPEHAQAGRQVFRNVQAGVSKRTAAKGNPHAHVSVIASFCTGTPAHAAALEQLRCGPNVRSRRELEGRTYM
eukprot:351342-Chlamydomonas_euryale.AAC.3